MIHQYYIYIITNKPNGVLYIGVTRDLQKRLEQHKNKEILGFTQKYNLNLLVYAEKYEMISDAIAREKQLKNWRRSWKIDLIEKYNPNWDDLSYKDFFI